jgi:proteasome lid subunit RPN8/RPN11
LTSTKNELSGKELPVIPRRKPAASALPRTFTNQLFVKNKVKTKTHIENEQCWILVGKRQGSFWQCAMVEPTTGTPTEVEFSFESVLKRDESLGDIVGFLHTHPSGSLDPSRKDVETMRAWTSCLGRPLICMIACDEAIEAFLFMDDECDGWRLSAAEHLNDQTVIVCDRRLSKLENQHD